ncbi:MAG: hypothetical protein LQ340_006484 [Diploschistes diacapsis]|nr:MAG: hypothetical protein LQ340_006484 [Diploschistes diacapsis]
MAMTIASVIIPRWISWNLSSTSGAPIHYTYGLHSRCSSVTGECDPFPTDDVCREDRYFCNAWRSVGFLMSFAVVLEGMTLVAFIVMLSSGVQKRTSGWKTVTVLLGLVALVQCVAMGLLAHIYEVDDRFFPGWHFDTSFILCTVSWCTQILVGGGLVASAFLLETEGGYELLPQENMMPQTEERAEGFEP